MPLYPFTEREGRSTASASTCHLPLGAIGPHRPHYRLQFPSPRCHCACHCTVTVHGGSRSWEGRLGTLLPAHGFGEWHWHAEGALQGAPAEARGEAPGAAYQPELEGQGERRAQKARRRQSGKGARGGARGGGPVTAGAHRRHTRSIRFMAAFQGGRQAQQRAPPPGLWPHCDPHSRPRVPPGVPSAHQGSSRCPTPPRLRPAPAFTALKLALLLLKPVPFLVTVTVTVHVSVLSGGPQTWLPLSSCFSGLPCDSVFCHFLRPCCVRWYLICSCHCVRCHCIRCHCPPVVPVRWA